MVEAFPSSPSRSRRADAAGEALPPSQHAPHGSDYLCACANCSAWREEEAEQEARQQERMLAAVQLRLPISPIPHCAGQPAGTLAPVAARREHQLEF